MLGNSGLIVGLLNQVDKISEQFVFDGYKSLVEAYSPANASTKPIVSKRLLVSARDKLTHPCKAA